MFPHKLNVIYTSKFTYIMLCQMHAFVVTSFFGELSKKNKQQTTLYALLFLYCFRFILPSRNYLKAFRSLQKKKKEN